MHTRSLLLFVFAAAVAACVSSSSTQTSVASAVPVSSSAPEIGRDVHATASSNGGSVVTTSGKASQSGSLDPFPNAPARAIKVTQKGFEPALITAKAGVPMALVFTRTTDKTCATEAIFPWLGNQELKLPLNQPARISFTPPKTGDLKFACGMHMIVGTLAVTN